MVVGEEGAVLAVAVVAVVTTVVLLSSKGPTLEDVLEGGE